MDSHDRQQPSKLPPIDGPLAFVLTGDDAALAATDFDYDSADELHAWAGDPLIGRRLAEMERPRPGRASHPARLIMHASARMFRYDSRSPDLGMDYLEALDACLDQGLDAWAGIAAREWVNFRHHTGDLDGVWRSVEVLLARYPVEDLPPRVASPLAQLAARLGMREEALALWTHARGHEDLRRSARAGWLVEHEWAQGYLMLLAGEPARAAATLRRVHAGLEAWDDQPARVRLLEAALELAFALVFAGRAEDASAALEHSAAVFAGDPEYGAWIEGLRALAYALRGRVEEAEGSLAIAADASSDTTTLDLNACIPARMVLASIAREHDVLMEQVATARRITFECTVDLEQEVIWRLFGVLAFHVSGNRAEAHQLARELEALLAGSTLPLPLYRDHVDLLVGLVERDQELVARARLALERRAVVMAGPAQDCWGLVGRAAELRVEEGADLPLRLAVLDGLRVEVGGQPVDAKRWAGRRKSRTVLALLVAAGGRIERDLLLEELWKADSGTTAPAPRLLSTVLSTIRSTLGGAGAELPMAAAHGERSLRIRGAMVELVLGPNDSTDVDDLRLLVQDVVSSDPRDADRFERLAGRLLPLVAGTPLRDIGSESIVTTWHANLLRELVDACAAVVGRWIVATAGNRPVPSPAMVELARAAHRMDPYDEVAVGNLVDLLAWSGRAAEASLTFHRFRDRIGTELGLQPSVELVRRHASIID